MFNMKIVAVGSTNPAKVKAVEKVFKKLNFRVKVLAVSCETSVGPQPIGLEKVVLGALERGLKALEKTDADWGVGIEAGLIPVPATLTGYLDFQAVAIVDAEMKVSLGFSPGFEFPEAAVNSVIKGESPELEDIMVKMTGIERIGEKIGAVGFLTRGLVVREDLSQLAFLMALIPRLNPDLYKSYPRADKVVEALRKKISKFPI